MGKHLLDETAEFKMPREGKHAAGEDDGLEPTQRFDPGFSSRRQPPVPGTQEGRDER